jgi:two-component system cell cycle sensor histidine kinase/response regulator CckA
MAEAARVALDPESLAEALGEIVFTNLPDGSCDYASRRFADLTGIAQEAARGFGWAAAVHPKDIDRVKARCLESLRSGSPFATECRLRGADGAYRWFLVRKVPLREAGGAIVKWLGVCLDITERRGLEVERDELLGRLRLQTERMPLAYILLDADCRITDWNPAAQMTFGYSKEEVLGMRPPFEKLVPPAARQQTEEVLRRIRSGDMHAHSVNDNLTKEGRTITCQWFNTPLVEGGRFSGMLCLAQEVTERKRLEEQFVQAQKMEAVGRLAGGVAHDFNNLLTVINGYGSLLLSRLPAGDPSREPIAEMTKAGEHAAGLTRQLLAFSRKQVLRPEVLDLNEVIRDTEKMLRRVLGEDIAFATDLQPTLGRVHADPGQMGQVILNLAVNARDAMPTGGKLTLETKNVYLDESYSRTHAEAQPGPHVLLAVSDTGCGMTPEVQARLFEPFFTTKASGRGTGLGLATVHGIVKQSGGHIGVYSEPRVGTTFKVYLPRVERPLQPGKSYQGTRPAPRGNETVLLVEDDDGVRALAHRILQDSGYNVLVAASGRGALGICEQQGGPIHLLVTDVVMPEMGGRPLAEQLLGLHPELKVLYLSGYTDDAVIRHGVLEAEVNFLQKPFEPAALAQKVREVLDAPRA